MPISVAIAPGWNAIGNILEAAYSTSMSSVNLKSANFDACTKKATPNRVISMTVRLFSSNFDTYRICDIIRRYLEAHYRTDIDDDLQPIL